MQSRKTGIISKKSSELDEYKKALPDIKHKANQFLQQLEKDKDSFQKIENELMSIRTKYNQANKIFNSTKHSTNEDYDTIYQEHKQLQVIFNKLKKSYATRPSSIYYKM